MLRNRYYLSEKAAFQQPFRWNVSIFPLFLPTKYLYRIINSRTAGTLVGSSTLNKVFSFH
jgi:hypothetical protein